jgi:hypothetical protein
MKAKTYAMSFDGALLGRGFWLYVWRITNGKRRVLYVGRTGDNASPHASSPFKRIGQHLDTRPNARSNALARQLKEAALEPERCTFEMVAVGPLFPEQEDMERHRPFRDQAGALERALAEYLREAGHVVIGKHARGAIECDKKLFVDVCRVIDQKLGPAKRRT